MAFGCCRKRSLTFLIYVLVALFSFAISALEWIYQEPPYFDPLTTKLFTDNLHHLTSSNNGTAVCPKIIYYDRFNTSSKFSYIHSPNSVHPNHQNGDDQLLSEEEQFQLFEMVVVSPNYTTIYHDNDTSNNHDSDGKFNNFETLIVLFHSHGEYSERYCLFFNEFYKVNGYSSDRIAFYAYDMRGHGYSSGLGRSFWRTYHEHLQDMDQIIEERIPFILNHVLKSPNAKVYFVAHSTSVLNLLWNDYLNSQHSESNHYNPLKTFKARVKNFSGVFLSSPTISMSFIYNQVFWITPYGKGNSSNFEYYLERIERAISNFNLNVLTFLVVPVLRIFPSLPLYPPFGIPCGQPKCRERFINDTIIYKGYWKSSTSISILEEMRNVKILLASFNPDRSQSQHCIPTSVVYGEADNFFLWEETKYLFSNHFKRITWKSYPNLKHDVFHEDFKDSVCRDLLLFVKSK